MGPYDPNDPNAAFPPMWAMADAPLQNAGPTQVQSTVAPGGMPMDITPGAQEYAENMAPGLEAQMPTDGTIGGGAPAADMSQTSQALLNNETQPADPSGGSMGLMGILGIANMAAGMGRQIYEALKPKPKPRINLRGGLNRNPYA